MSVPFAERPASALDRDYFRAKQELEVSASTSKTKPALRRPLGTDCDDSRGSTPRESIFSSDRRDSRSGSPSNASSRTNLSEHELPDGVTVQREDQEKIDIIISRFPVRNRTEQLEVDLRASIESLGSPQRPEPAATNDGALHRNHPYGVALAAFSPSFDPVSPERDLILPIPIATPVGETNPATIEDDDETAQAQVPQAAVKQEVDNTQAATNPSDGADVELGFFRRQIASVRRKYNPTEDPPLVLPSGPTDEEKYCYLNTRRLPLYFFGVISFLSLSAGMWLFSVSSLYFYWFGGFVGIMQIYLIISYIVGICGRDYDFEAHKLAVEGHAITPDNAPTVDIYLPCCKEPMEILENTYKYVQAMQYPEGKLNVHVLDDGGMDAVKELATSYGFNYITRDDKPRLKKAGNLRWAFARTNGDFFVIYDADFCPRSDFLLELIPVMKSDPEIAIVQTPQFFRTSDDQTWVEQGAGSIQELFYRIVQINRDRWGASICVGSNAVYRREALVETGGTAEIGFSEDVHTGFYAVNRGWKLRYVPLCLACGICPDTPRAFFSQQMRWCMGSTTLLTNPDFWTSNLSLVQKICYLSGMMYYSATALGIFINPLPGVLLMWFRPEFLKYYNLAFAVPSLLYSLIAIRLWARAKYSIHVQYIMAIQQYAYLTAIKDRLFGTALAWVPSGDTKAHKNNKYRNMRILAWCWTITYEGFLISGVVYCILTGWAWYNFVPILCLNAFNLFVTHRFLFCP